MFSRTKRQSKLERPNRPSRIMMNPASKWFFFICSFVILVLSLEYRPVVPYTVVACGSGSCPVGSTSFGEQSACHRPSSRIHTQFLQYAAYVLVVSTPAVAVVGSRLQIGQQFQLGISLNSSHLVLHPAGRTCVAGERCR